jgi:hypothetical protein
MRERIFGRTLKKTAGSRERKREPAVVLGRMEMNLVSTDRSACFSGCTTLFITYYGRGTFLDASKETELVHRTRWINVR